MAERLCAFAPLGEAGLLVTDTVNVFSLNRQGATPPAGKRLTFALVAMLSIGPVLARPQQTAASPSSAPLLQLSPAEIEIYTRARTLIDWTPRQVRNSLYLRGVIPVARHEQLPVILKRVGQSDTLLFQNFPQVSCDEEVLSEASLLDPSQRLPVRHYPTVDRKFRYIVIPLPGGDLPGFEEYRTSPRGNPTDGSKPGDLYMLTADFASIALYLRPSDQPITRFRYFGAQTIGNHACYVVGFAQDALQARRIGEVRIGGKSFCILLQGLAWIDSVTFQILRMETWLLAPRMDIGLKTQTSTVDFEPVKPTGSEKVLWLPRKVTVEIDYHNREIRNTHLYSNFKLFRVESTIRTGE